MFSRRGHFPKCGCAGCAPGGEALFTAGGDSAADKNFCAGGASGSENAVCGGSAVYIGAPEADELELVYGLRQDGAGAVIRTGRLLLRPVEEGDLNDFFAYGSNQEVALAAGWPAYGSIFEALGVMQALFIGREGAFGITFPEEGRLIGTICLSADERRSNPRVRELGYSLARRYWGQELMTEAAAAVVGWGWENLDLELISACCTKENVRSRRVLEKCGFEYEGCLRRCEQLPDGKIADCEFFSILRPD